MESPFDVFFKHNFMTQKDYLEDVVTQKCVCKDWSDIVTKINLENMENLMSKSFHKHFPSNKHIQQTHDIDKIALFKFLVSLKNNYSKNEQKVLNLIAEENIQKLFTGVSTNVGSQVNTIGSLLDIYKSFKSKDFGLTPYFAYIMFIYFNNILVKLDPEYVSSHECLLGNKKFVRVTLEKAVLFCEGYSSGVQKIPLLIREVIVNKIDNTRVLMDKLPKTYFQIPLMIVPNQMPMDE